MEMTLPHSLSLTDRTALTVTGVSEVLSLEETAAQLSTEQGCLWVHGEGLRLKDLEGGRLTMTGKIAALVYEDSAPKRGWLSRLRG